MAIVKIRKSTAVIIFHVAEYSSQIIAQKNLQLNDSAGF